LDALSAWLPEWREVAGLSTGSYYHTYTVDEHTLRALERLDSLPGDMPEQLPLSLWKTFKDRPLVYLSILFHDIAKGRPGDHSQVGAEMARRGLARVGLEGWAGDVSRLVRLHLRMEQVAFRRDAKDPNVLADFAEEVGDTRTLETLYLLTICDLSAVSERVWTTWKSHLLAELYLETREWFAQGRKLRPASVAEDASRVAALLGGDESRAHGFIASMREEYRRAVPAEEIAEHVRSVEQLRKGEDFRWLIEKREGYIVLTLITWDRVGLLADIAGLLVTQGIGIREARIFTRSDGVVVDRFRAEDTQPGGVPLEERLEAIPNLWKGIAAGSVTTESLLGRHRRTRRLDRTPAAVIESDITINPHPEGYMVDVSGPDSIGLLYRLCSVLSSEGLDVRAARVSRRIDGIVDAFLVHDPNNRLDDQSLRLNLIQQLHEALDAR
jgi:[protein-PII] uridylyltransferase